MLVAFKYVFASMMASLLLFFWLLFNAINGFPHGGASCKSDWDCSLGGICASNNQTCICDAWFTGANCTYLNLAHAETNYGFQVPKSYSWGGHAGYDPSTNKYVGFFAFMVNHCSLSQWTTNSEIVMTTADEPHGPYDHENYTKIVSPWSHNPYLVQYKNQNMIWHIGNGKTSVTQNCSSSTESIIKTEEESTFFVQISNDSLYGPWTEYENNAQIVINETWQSSASNPAPFIFPNGTTLLFFSSSHCPQNWGNYDRCIAVGKADHWSGPYESISSLPIVHPESEDPAIFQDPRGNFHLLTNVNTGHKRCDATVPCGGHAWSKDGITWSQQFIGAFGPVIHLKNGSTWTNAYIERPQVYQDAMSKIPITFFGGMGRSSYADSISWAQPFCNDELLNLGQCDPTIAL